VWYSGIHANRHTYGNRRNDRNADRNTHNYSKTVANCETSPNTAASDHPGTAPIAFAHEKETHCQSRFL
jgi:hypothetical protein